MYYVPGNPTLQVYRAMMAHPIATAATLATQTGLTQATVNKSLVHLQRLGVVTELTAQKRNRIFSYAAFIDIMNQGSELPGKN